MDELIRTIIRESDEKKLPSIIERDADLTGHASQKVNKIITVSGFRRVGKTYLLLETMGKLKGEKLYLNFEDERIPLKTEFLTKLGEALKSKPGLRFLFLDEIQDMPAWGRWLRRFYDTGNLRIFVTGSSSKMSSREIPTELRGRCLEIRLSPLSFNEFLRFKETKPEGANEFLLEEYLKYGGMPEVVLSEEAKKKPFLQSYYNTFVRKDVIERYKIRNEDALKALVIMLLDSTSYSASKLRNTLESLGYKVGKGTVQKYVSCLEDSYFMHSLLVFSHKIKNRMQAPRKVYFVDNGFISYLSSRLMEKRGRLYENAVFCSLQRSLSEDLQLFYWKDVQGYEVDFLVADGGRVSELIQVCYNINDHDTKRRETRALIRASKETGCNSLKVVTSGYRGEEELEWYGTRRRIEFIPMIDFLLGR